MQKVIEAKQSIQRGSISSHDLPRFGAEIQVEQVVATKKTEIDEVSLKILDSSLEKEDFPGAKQ